MRGDSNKNIRIVFVFCLVLLLIFFVEKVLQYNLSLSNLFNLSPKIIAENFSDNLWIKTELKIPQQLDMLTFATFDPYCCPSVYTSSSGCMCIDNEEDLAIITRGGNRLYTKNDHWINIASRSTDKRNGKRPDSHAHKICNV